MEVLKTAAANEGSAGLMQAGVGLAVGAGLGQQMAQQAGNLSTHLPPALQFHVAEAGKSTGPFNGTQLQQMFAAGTFKASSLVWRQGMTAWLPASTVRELAGLFTPPVPTATPPVPPAA